MTIELSFRYHKSDTCSKTAQISQHVSFYYYCSQCSWKVGLVIGKMLPVQERSGYAAMASDCPTVLPEETSKFVCE